MIQYGSIKRGLLNVLMKSGTPVDRSKCVPVIETAHGVHGDYITTKWKLPEMVTKDDKPIGNFHLLPKDHPHYKPNGPKYNEHSHPPDYVKRQVDNWVEHTYGQSQKEFYDFLAKNNIKWEYCPTSKGISYMRAKIALKKAVFFNGFDVHNPKPLTDDPIEADTHTPATSPVLGGNGKKLTSQQSKQRANDYFKAIGSDDSVLKEHLAQWGIKWPESTKSGDGSARYNHMKMLEYLSLAIENGFDPQSPNKEEPVDPSILDIPKGATPRQIALIQHINKLNDIETIEACARVGAVPEDERAKEFIVNRLQRNLVNTLSKAAPQVKQRIDEEWGKGVLTRLKAQLSGSSNTYANNSEGFGRQMADVIALAGCKKNVVFEGFQTLANKFNMSVLTDPLSTLSTPIQNGSRGINKGTQISDLIQGLNEGYSNHVTDGADGFQSNLGYSGFDPDKYLDRLNKDDGNHDGFCLYLDKISKDNPQVQDVVDNMKTTYKELLKVCQGNPNLMNLVLHSDTWKNNTNPDYIPNSFGQNNFSSREDALSAVQQMDKSYKVVMDTLKQRGYSDNDILNALQDTVHNDDLSNFHIAGDIINFREIKASNNKPYLKKAECQWGKNALLCAQAMFVGEQSGDRELKSIKPPSGTEEAWGHYKAAKQIQDFTAEQYIQAHKLSHELFGFKFTQTVNQNNKPTRVPLDYSKINVNRSWKLQQCTLVVENPPEDNNTVLTNLIMGNLYHSINTSITQNITKNAQGMFNNTGADYSGNFDYYSGSLMGGQSDKRYTQLGNNSGNGATYTAQQLSDKITNQMNSMPNYTADYLNNVRSYYNNVGHSSMGDSFVKFFNKNVESIMENPIKDVLFQVSHNIAGFTPNMASKPKYDTQMAKRLNYVPFDFSQPKTKQPRFNPNRTAVQPPPPDPATLKAARQKLLEKATCSLQTTSKEESIEYQQKMTGPDMDYKDPAKVDVLAGEKYEANPDGHTPTNLLHSGKNVRPENKRTVIFNSPVFKVNNSIYEDQFNSNQEKWSSSNNPQEKNGSKSMELYQGLSYSSTAGHIKQDQDVDIDTIAALGVGKYYTYKVGEAAKFVGDQHVNVSKLGSAALKEPARGIIGMATVMRGPNYSTNMARDLKSNVSSLSGDHYSQLQDFELCTKMSGLAHTHHIVDVTIVNLGINAIKTPDGIVKASTRELMADNNGVSINMVYGEDVMSNGY